MSDISGPFSIYIEDWSSVTLTDVIPAGQKRWYDGVTGYNASEIIELVGDGSTQVQNLDKRQPSTDGVQTLYGVKTFDDIPLLPAANPTTDDEATRKAYVDASISASLGLPLGYITGLSTESAADADHDIIINTGKCRDYDDSVDIEVSSAITKQIDAAWSAGDNAGGLFSGTVAADTTYHLFVIRKDSDGTIDAGFDTDIDCGNIPIGYTSYRRVASFVTDASSNIISYSQIGDRFSYHTLIVDYNNSSVGSSRTTTALSMPSDIALSAVVNVGGRDTNGRTLLVSPVFADDVAPTSTIHTIRTSSAGQDASLEMIINTDTSAQITFRSSGNFSGPFRILTLGYYDDRGKFGGK